VKALWFGAIGALLALVALSLAWELMLAPLRPGGSWLMLKALPLLVPLRGMLHGRRRTFQWVPFLALAYVAEGAVRAWGEPAPVRPLALLQLALAVALFLCAAFYARRAGAAARAAG
jgi:uncharacterized membrane protein